MPRDYARSRSRESDSSGPSGFVWLLAGVFIGLIIAGVFYLKNQSKPRGITLPQEKVAAQPQQQTQPVKKPAPSPDKLQTQFDFYNVLPSQKVVGPTGDEDTTQIQNQNANPNPAPQPAQPQTTAPAATPQTPQQPAAEAPVVQATPAPTTPPKPAAPSATPKPTSYILQIASFAHYGDADQLKAQLSLLGFDVKISNSQKSGKTLQRVWLGPYSTKDEALSVQKQLQENLISSKVLKSPN